MPPPMESLSVLRSSSPPFRNLSKIPNNISSFILKVPNAQIPLQCVAKSHFRLTAFNASETVVSSTESISEKINLDAFFVSIEEFFNRYPFFVAGCFLIWLIVFPVTQDYLSKYKFISALDAFLKLREDPNAQLLDIRDAATLKSLPSPNLRILNKNVVQVEYIEEDEDGFLKTVLQSFPDPAKTVLCLLDNSDDDDSLKAAELLFKNGFKEAYAIKGGVRGNKGWLATQESFPSSSHIKPRKKKKKKVDVLHNLGVNGGLNQGTANIEDTSSAVIPTVDSHETGIKHEETSKSRPDMKIDVRSTSPYPNYPDLKPPSSPTPSKP